jgi:hypothetical protein
MAARGRGARARPAARRRVQRQQARVARATGRRGCIARAAQPLGSCSCGRLRSAQVFRHRGVPVMLSRSTAALQIKRAGVLVRVPQRLEMPSHSSRVAPVIS